MTRKLIRLMFPLLAFAFGCAATVLFLRPAFADPGSPSVAPGTDWAFWIAVASAAGTALSLVLHRVAATTHSEKLEAVARDIDEVRGMAGAVKPALSIAKAPGSGTAAMLAILLLGALAAPALTGCTATQARRTASAGVVAALDCESVHLDAQLAIDLRLTADAYVKRWITGTGATSTDAIAADLAPIKSDAVKCAIVGALAAATTLIAPPAPVAGTAVSALSVPGPDPAVVRDRFRLAARALGWAPVRIVGGDVI